MSRRPCPHPSRTFRFPHVGHKRRTETKQTTTHRDSLPVDGTQVTVLEETDQMGLGRLLEGQYGRALPPVSLPHHGLLDLPHQPGERQPPDEEVRRGLVLPDLLEGLLTWICLFFGGVDNSARAETRA